MRIGVVAMLMALLKRGITKQWVILTNLIKKYYTVICCQYEN